jgi:hypothetical protein
LGNELKKFSNAFSAVGKLSIYSINLLINFLQM